jgi:hypothetical protein
MKDTPRRRITATSSVNEIFPDQMGNRVVVSFGGVTPLVHTPFLSRLLDKYLKRGEQFGYLLHEFSLLQPRGNHLTTDSPNIKMFFH